MNHDAQAAAQAGKGMTGWKSDREFISSAFQSNGLLIGDRMLSPLQARSLQVKKHAKKLGKMGSAPRHSSINALVFTEPSTSWALAILLPRPRKQGRHLKDSVTLYSRNFKSLWPGEFLPCFFSCLPFLALTGYEGLESFAFCH